MRQLEEAGYFAVEGPDGMARVVHGIKNKVADKHSNALPITAEEAAGISAALRARAPQTEAVYSTAAGFAQAPSGPSQYHLHVDPQLQELRDIVNRHEALFEHLVKGSVAIVNEGGK